MSNEMNGGVSKRSLLLLGGLAALALNKDTRRALVQGSRTAWTDAQTTLEGTVKPTLAQGLTQGLAQAQELSQGLAHEAARRGHSAAQLIREEGVPRASSLLSSMLDEVVTVAGGLAGTAGELAGTAQERAGALAGGLADTTQAVTKQGRQQAGRLLSAAQHSAGDTLVGAQGAGKELLATVHDRVSSTLHEVADGAQTRQRRMDRTLKQARRDAERELAAGRRALSPAKLQKAVDRKVAPLQKELARELKVLEKQTRRARRDDRSGGPAGSLTALALIGTGAVVLARVPAARQGILSAVEGVSPEAAQSLRQAGRNARNLIGTAWLERIEENKATPAPGAAQATQAATTGSSAGGAVAPDAPAAARTAAESGKPAGDTKPTN
ncbi:alginate biosynthesis protein AlgP [Deinococcus sp. A31D244]|uniref:alginate biosynthesis protein AlgP n=1 Tax=Deinococcus sp. A31D244 TaxID=3397675 RepID=UPI0039E0D3B1